MAEIFGTAAAALSVAGLFTNCVQCFEYVQLGRNFGKDYETYILRIRITLANLERWGEAVRIDENLDLNTLGSDSDRSVSAHEILANILATIQSLYNKSKRYEINQAPEDRLLGTEADLSPHGQRLDRHLQKVMGLRKQRQKSTNLFKKTAWALYDRKSLDNTLQHLKNLVDDLKELYPAEAQPSRLLELAGGELEGVEDQDLPLLQIAASGLDDDMSKAVEEKVQQRRGLNSARGLAQAGSAQVHIGNNTSDKAVESGYEGSNNASNIADDANVSGNARLQVGNNVGGKGFWD